jgi:PleD family two-component response regulator
VPVRRPFFATPLDSYRIAARIDELLGRLEAPPYRVLIVEDDRELAVQCGQWIAAEGMTARVAAHGSAAIAALNDFQPDAVLIDATLPDARGIDLVQVMRQQAEHATLPIVMAAEAGDAAERFDAIAAGADEVLVKPLKARHVVGVIRSRVQRAQWLRAQAEAGAARDPKTGLYSRSLVIERIAGRIGTQGSALMMIQFDDVDALRGQIGLSALAAVDVDIGMRLRDLLANHDMACGLRDFAWLLLLTRDRRELLSQLAERVRFAIVERPLSIGNAVVPVSASIGLVALDDAPTDADTAVQAAERACTDAKARGGNIALWSGRGRRRARRSGTGGARHPQPTARPPQPARGVPSADPAQGQPARPVRFPVLPRQRGQRRQPRRLCLVRTRGQRTRHAQRLGARPGSKSPSGSARKRATAATPCVS